MNNKKTLLVATLLVISLTLSSVLSVFAGTYSLRIDPPLPIMSESPAPFIVSVQPPNDVTNAQIFLAITDACYTDIGDVVVSWNSGADSVTIVKGDWNMETVNSVKAPHPGVDEPPAYTVASLKSHLLTGEPIYWALAPILDGITIEVGEEYPIEVTLSSSNPAMLVYVLGDADGSIDTGVPPTIPGFTVPEVPLGTIASLLTMVGSMAVLRRRKK